MKKSEEKTIHMGRTDKGMTKQTTPQVVVLNMSIWNYVGEVTE